MSVCVRNSPNAGEDKMTPARAMASLKQWLFPGAKYDGEITIAGTQLQAALRMTYDAAHPAGLYQAQHEVALRRTQDWERKYADSGYTTKITEFVVRDEKGVITHLL